jgi:hypothetical protein
MLFYGKIFSNDDIDYYKGFLIDHFTEVTTFTVVITFTKVTTFTEVTTFSSDQFYQI